MKDSKEPKTIIDLPGIGWSPMPNILIRSNLLTPQEKCVWSCLASYNPSFPTYIELTKRLRISEDTLSSAIRRLIELCMLRVAKGRLGRANQYEILPVSSWIAIFEENEVKQKAEITIKKKEYRAKKLKGQSRISKRPTSQRTYPSTTSQIGTIRPIEKYINSDTSLETVKTERTPISKSSSYFNQLKALHAKQQPKLKENESPTPHEEVPIMSEDDAVESILSRLEDGWNYLPHDEFEPCEPVESIITRLESEYGDRSA